MAGVGGVEDAWHEGREIRQLAEGGGCERSGGQRDEGGAGLARAQARVGREEAGAKRAGSKENGVAGERFRNWGGKG